MAQKKQTEKKDVKVRDLAPKKDAKGGAARSLDKGGASLDRGGSSLNRAGSSSLAGGSSLNRSGSQSAS